MACPDPNGFDLPIIFMLASLVIDYVRLLRFLILRLASFRIGASAHGQCGESNGVAFLHFGETYNKREP